MKSFLKPNGWEYMQKISVNNFFNYEKVNISDKEIFTKILSSKNIYLERIISNGQVTPEGEWLEDSRDEWVMLLKGKAKIKFFHSEEISLKEGDYLLIPSNTKHRVTYTSSRPKCFWLAIYFKSRF